MSKSYIDPTDEDHFTPVKDFSAFKRRIKTGQTETEQKREIAYSARNTIIEKKEGESSNLFSNLIIACNIILLFVVGYISYKHFNKFKQN